ncbi:hypothetical protein [Pedobacter sp. FW305-3-2-15-E-R2A2]|uniref:hypothetical protein n=1 Tax=Pedobacter sp. FW305-3-2-15-E-R2A2 TaxID=3140251 RepID=UPI00314063A7
MIITLLRIVLFCLIPVGIFLLIKTIRMLKKTFNGKVMAEIPFTQKETTFNLPEKGVYAIWQKGQLFRKTPVDKFEMHLSRESDGESIALTTSLLRPNMNGFETGRMEMKRFYAESGNYKLILRESSENSSFEQVFSDLFPAKMVDYNKYFIQVRESGPAYQMFLAIPLFLLSGFMIIGGFVCGLLLPQMMA